MKRFFILLLGTLLFSSCSVEPKPINYGKDACVYCKMNIVEKKFGAEIVTKKGKVFKYDAIECMVNAISEMDESSIKYFMAIDYNNPTQLVDATTSFHLKSEKIPSPMGAFLSSYKNEELAKKSQELNGGEIYSWEILKKKYHK